MALSFFKNTCIGCPLWSAIFSRNISTSAVLELRLSEVLCGEPLKKKKKADLALLHAKENRKKKRIEKEIRKITSKGRALKPVIEIEGTPAFVNTVNMRRRSNNALEFEELEYRALLHKDWTRYKTKQAICDKKYVATFVESQTKALEELRKESEELYQMAIQKDTCLIPFHQNFLLRTPPIEGYIAPDGDYFDTTQKFDK